MSHCHYTPSRRLMSMAELNHNKTLNIRLSEHLRSLAEEYNDRRYQSQSERVKYCSTWWNGFYCESCGKYHGMHTTGCKHRLCPICATRAARVTAIQAVEAISYVKGHMPELRLSLLTLTQRNVPGPDLNNELSAILKTWAHLQNQRGFRAACCGWARTVEIVPALALDGTYHPHVHAILLHEKGLPSAEWFAEKWRSGMGLDYIPVVDLRPITDEEGAVFEVSKYVCKMTRVYDGTEHEHDHVRYMTQAMNNRRLRTYGGEWRKARIALNMMHAEDLDDDALDEYGELNDLSGACPGCGSGTVPACLRWSGLRYSSIPNEIRVIPMDRLGFF